MKKITNFTKNWKLCEGVERLTGRYWRLPTHHLFSRLPYWLRLSFSLVQMVASLLHPHPSTWLRKVWLSSNARVNPDLSVEFKCWQFWSSENVCWDASGKRSLTPKELLRSLSTLVHSHVWVWLLELQQPFHKQEENNGGQSWDSEDGSTERDGKIPDPWWHHRDAKSANPETCSIPGLPMWMWLLNHHCFYLFRGSQEDSSQHHLQLGRSCMTDLCCVTQKSYKSVPRPDQ